MQDSRHHRIFVWIGIFYAAVIAVVLLPRTSRTTRHQTSPVELYPANHRPNRDYDSVRQI